MTFVMPPRGAFLALIDLLLTPFMYLASGTRFESPQRTHRWNYVSYRSRKLRRVLRSSDATHIRGVPSECEPWWYGIPRSHIPIIGGWRHYVVLEPEDPTVTSWYVGWLTPKSGGISRITLTGKVRMLRGPRDTWFFGVDKEGNQVPIVSRGTGVIGDGGKWKDIWLL
jgi:hypothetical protein